MLDQNIKPWEEVVGSQKGTKSNLCASVHHGSSCYHLSPFRTICVHDLCLPIDVLNAHGNESLLAQMPSV